MKSLFRPFPLPLTPRQKFYLFVLQGLGAGIIDGGANFGIAYAMYSKQDQVKMWIFSQNTIAGDLGVTPIIQCLASMLISSTLVHTDLHNHAIQPLAFCYPHVEHLPDPRDLLFRSRRKARREARATRESKDVEKAVGLGSESPSAGLVPSAAPPNTANPTNSSGGADDTTLNGTSTSSTPSLPSEETSYREGSLSYYYWMLIRFIFEGTEHNMMLARPGLSAWFGRLAWTAAQGAAIGIVFGFPLWCLAIVILAPIYGMGNMGGTWAPQVIKGVFGAVVGWVTNPVIAVLALGSQADCHLLVVEEKAEHEGEGGEGHEGNAGEDREANGNDGEGEEILVPPIPTIHEGQEFDPLATPSKFVNAGRRPSATPTHSSFRLPAPASPLMASTSPIGRSSLYSRSRAGSDASQYSMPRSRRGSGSRPPLTANVSFIAPLPLTSSTAGPGPSTSGIRLRAQSQSNTSITPSGSTPLLSSSSLRGRPRGATVSHMNDAEQVNEEEASMNPVVPPSPSPSFVYALGGTGGRAQRSRSGSVMSTSNIPAVVVPDDNGAIVDRHTIGGTAGSGIGPRSAPVSRRGSAQQTGGGSQPQFHSNTDTSLAPDPTAGSHRSHDGTAAKDVFC